jgi:hypothetical protein
MNKNGQDAALVMGILVYRHRWEWNNEKIDFPGTHSCFYEIFGVV